LDALQSPPTVHAVAAPGHAKLEFSGRNSRRSRFRRPLACNQVGWLLNGAEELTRLRRM